MTSEAPSRTGDAHRVPPIGKLLGVALILGSLSASASLLSARSWQLGGVTILWPSNGYLIGVLLCTPRRQWPAFLGVGFFVDFWINTALGSFSWPSAYLAGCNMLEAGLGAFLMFDAVAPHPDLTERKQLRSLLLYGMIVPPAISSFLASLLYFKGRVFATMSQLHFFQLWVTADALGVATMTPLYLSFRQRQGFGTRTKSEISILFLLLFAVTAIVFWQTRLPLFFLVMPFLLLIGVRLGLAGSASGLLMVAIVGGFLTTMGHGPVALMSGVSLAGRELIFQFFVAVSMLVLYIVEVISAESARLQMSLQASEARFRLLAESSRDVIVLTNLEGERHYVSPAVTEVLGWQPDEMLRKTYREIVHPEDAPLFAQLLKDCRDGKPTRVLAYRCGTKSGAYRWLETNPRLYRDPSTGEPAGIVSVVRDIADRKSAEEELAKAFHMVQNLATIDGLTGIANRRRFDETLEREWRRAVRERTELSLVMLDVDHFKLFNDLYGHLCGDDCLRQIADSIQKVVTRASDLSARYGGEEFALILPNTSRSGALEVCSQILTAVRRRGIAHEGNLHGVVTVSAGCVTRVPDEKSSPLAMLQAADAALYRAKALGRNRIEVADMSARMH